MTIAVGKFTKDENDLFDIMDDWLQRDRFVFVGWSGLLLFPCAYFAVGGWFIGTTFVTSWYTHVRFHLNSHFLSIVLHSTYFWHMFQKLHYLKKKVPSINAKTRSSQRQRRVATLVKTLAYAWTRNSKHRTTFKKMLLSKLWQKKENLRLACAFFKPSQWVLH